MPSNIPATTIRIDPEVKREATAILDELGLSMSTAVNAFLRALVREGGMPFEMRVRTRSRRGNGEIAGGPARNGRARAGGLSDLERIAPLPDLSPARGRLFCNLRI